MKLIILPVILLFPIIAFANDLQVVSAQIGCMDKSKGLYSYKALLVVKNISKENLSLITKSSGSVTIPKYGNTPAEIVITHGERTINDVPIIPSAEQLGIVTLYPGEGAEINHTFSSANVITTASI